MSGWESCFQRSKFERFTCEFTVQHKRQCLEAPLSCCVWGWIHAPGLTHVWTKVVTAWFEASISITHPYFVRQYTTCPISVNGKHPYRRKKASYGLFHFLKSPYGIAVWVSTLSQYGAGGLLLRRFFSRIHVVQISYLPLPCGASGWSRGSQQLVPIATRQGWATSKVDLRPLTWFISTNCSPPVLRLPLVSSHNCIAYYVSMANFLGI